MKQMRRGIALLLAVAMSLTIWPVSAFASMTETSGTESESAETYEEVYSSETEPVFLSDGTETDATGAADTTEATESTGATEASETVVASGSCGASLTWKLNEAGVLTISGTGEMSSSPWASYKSSITSVVVEEGVTSLVGSAFYGYTAMKSIDLPDSLTSIGSYAFYQCTGLTGELVIPNNVTDIGDYAFWRCTGLTSLTLGSSVANIGNHAFNGCNGLEGDLVIPNSVTAMGTYAFANCSKLTGLTLSNSLTSISNNAFSGCSSLTGELEIPDQITSIGEYAFYYCRGLTGELVIPDQVTSIGFDAFYNCTGLTSLTLGSSLTEIQSSAFRGCTGMTGQLVLPDSLKTIGGNAFRSCTGLTGELIIPDQVTSIEASAFEGCTAVTTLRIGDSVTNIGYWAFKDMTALTSIEFGLCSPSIGVTTSYGSTYITFEGCAAVKEITFNALTPPTLHHNIFVRMTKLETVTIPVASYAAYMEIFKAYLPTTAKIQCPGAAEDMIIQDNVLVAYLGEDTEVEIPDTVTAIGTGAFMNNTAVTKVTVPASVTSIGAGAFRGCTALVDMVLPETLTSIGEYAFYSCSSWTGPLVIPAAVETVEPYTFYNCSALTGELSIPETVTTIGTYAFYGCSSLTGSLNLPANLTSIGSYAFYNCSGLTGDLRIPDTVTSLAAYAFYGCSGFDGKLTLSEQLTAISSCVFEGCSGITGELVIPDSVATIGDKTFAGMKNLTSVVFGANTTTIGSSSSSVFSPFYTCSALKTITFTGLTVPTVKSNIFYSMSKLEKVYLPAGVFVDYMALLQKYIGYLAATARLIPLNYTEEFLIEDGVLLAYTGEGGEVTIPDGVTAINALAFQGCSAITKLIVPEGVTSIGAYAFRGCTGMTEIQLPTTLTTIAEYAFYECTGLTGITFPENLTTIGKYAFYKCSALTGDLTIPASVVTVDQYAFYQCTGLNGTLTFEASETVGRTIGNYAFYQCYSLTGLEIGDGVATIGNYAFYGCSRMTGDLTLPDSVTSLGEYAFYNCPGLNGTLTLSNGLTVIKVHTFNGAKNITGTVVVPDGVTQVHYYAFQNMSSVTSFVFGTGLTILGTKGYTNNSYGPLYGCSGVTEVTFNGTTPPTFYGNPFVSMTQLETVYVPEEAYSAYTEALSAYLPSTARIQIIGANDDFQIEDGVLTAYLGEGGEITIPDSVTAIGTSAFQNCTTITKVTIPDSVASIGAYAFSGCTALAEVNLPATLTSIGTCAFQNCSSVTGELVIPDGVTVIADKAFSGMSGVTSVVLGTGVTTLGSSTTASDGPFYGCSGVTEVTFKSETAPEIAADMFYSMSGVKTVNVPADAYENYALSLQTLLPDGARFRCWDTEEEFLIRDGVLVAYLGDDTAVEIPQNVTAIGTSAFQHNTTMTTLTIPDTITSIGSYAFEYCTAWTGDLVIPDSVESIGEHAFESCKGLNGTLTLSANLNQIPAHAFASCSALTGSLVIPDTVTSVGDYAFNGCSGFTGTLTLSAALTSIGKLAFYNCCGFTGDLTIPDSVVSLGSRSFYCCEGFDGTLTLSSGLLEIPEQTFMYCSGFTGELVIPDSVKYVEDFSFYGLSSIESIVFGTGVTRIGNYTSYLRSPFYGCGAVKQVTFMGETCPAFNSNMFYSMAAGLETVYLMQGAYSGFVATCVTWLKSATEIVIMDAEEDFIIEDGVLISYQGADGEVVIPEGVTAIGLGAFLNRADVTKVTFPDTVTSIGERAFSNCTGLTAADLPESLEEIGAYAFNGCTALSGMLTIPDNVKTIGNYAFYKCSALNGLDLGSGVTTIGTNAFYNCSGMTGDLTIPDSVTSIGKYAFYNCSGFDGKLTLSSNMTTIAEYTFSGCSGISGELVIPDDIRTLGSGCFSNMSSVESVVFGSGVTAIGSSTTNSNNPFYGCSGVTEITFMPTTVPTFNGNMFVSMSKLETVYVMEDAYDAYVAALSEYLDDSVTISTDFLKAKITGLKAAQAYSHTIVLSWNAHTSEKVVGYTITRDGEVIGTTDACTYTDRNLTAETSYTYTVQGYTEDGEVTGISQAIVKTVNPDILDIKTGSSVNKINEDANTVYIYVSDEGNLLALGEERTVGQLYYLSGEEYVLVGEAAVDADLSGSTTAVYTIDWDLTNLPDGAYEVMFRLTDVDGTTDEYSETVTIDRGVPAQIVGVTATGDVDVIYVSWAVAAELDTGIYRIYRRAESDTDYRLIAQINDRDVLTYADDSVRTDRTYYYYVVGVNELNQEGTPSLVVGATLAEDDEAPVVTKMTPASSTYLSGMVAFKLTVQDNVYVTGAKLAYSTDDGTSWTDFAELTPGTWTAQLDTTAISDGIIRVRAIAYDAAGNESTPLTYVYSVDNTGPEQVQGLSYESTNVSVTLRWDDVADEDIRFFRVEHKTGDDTYETLCDVYDTLGVNIYDLEPGTEYTYRVIGYDISGNRGVPSDDITVTTLNDASAPVITKIRPTASYFSSTISLAVTAEDEHNIASITIQLSTDLINWKDIYTQKFISISATRTMAYNLDITEYEEGTIYVRAIARDSGGNTSDAGVNAPYVQYIIDRTAPAEPQNVAAVGNCGNIEISWTQGEESDLNKYSVYRAEAEDGEYTLLKSGLTTLNYFDREVEEDVVYYYKVAVDDIAGNLSGFSAIVSAEVAEDTEPPVVAAVSPASGTVVGPGNNGVSVTVSDNHLLDSILIEYSRDGVTYETMYELSDVEEYGQYADARVPVTEFGHGDTVYVRVYAKDKAGNISDAFTAEYTVDAVAPAASEAAAVYESETEQVQITWTGNQETDLYGYRIYRGVEDQYSLITFCQAVAGQSEYFFCDVSLPAEKIDCTYKVEAVDQCGNTSAVFSNTVEIPDRQFPKAIISCDSTLEIGVEYVIDASFSSDNSSIVSYLIDFGDGTTSTEMSPIHSYDELGEYTITLTVEDDDGHTTVTTKTITVVERGAIGTVKIKVVDENGSAIPGAPVYFDLGESTQSMKKTDSTGCAVFIASAGVHAVGSVIANNEWLPAKKDVIVLAGSETSVTLTMVHQTLIEGEFEINRMTFEEIEAAGIDTSQPENQYVVQVNVKLTYESAEQETSFIFNMTTQEPVGEVGYDTNNDGIVDRNMTPVVIDETTIALLDVPIGASMLKEFFDVHLHIVNNAASEFSMLDNVITLNVPEGLSIVDAAGTQSSATVEIAEIPGQTTSTISWILRGDQVGEYSLSADYSGILGQFNEPIYTRFVSQDPIKVYGLNAVKLIAEVNSSANYDAFYFNLGLENVGDIDVNLPSIEITDNILTAYLTQVAGEADADVDVSEMTKTEATVRHLNTVLKNASGYSQYIGTESTVTTLSPGEQLMKKYAAYNVTGYDNLTHLQNAIYEIVSGYGIAFELIETDMDLFSTDNAAEKLADIAGNASKTAELSEILDCSQYFYVLESLDWDTNIFVREGSDLYSAMKKRMSIDSNYSAAHTAQVTRAAVAQMMVDESMQQAIASGADSKYLEITGSVLDKMGEWIAADCTSGDAAVWTSFLGGENNIRNLADKLSEFGTEYFVEFLIGKLTAAGMSAEGTSLIQAYFDDGKITEEMNSAVCAVCSQIAAITDSFETLMPAWSDSAEIVTDLIGIAAAQEEARLLLNMLVEFTDSGTAIQNELLSILSSMDDVERVLNEQFTAELNAAMQGEGASAEDAILSCLESVYGTGTGHSYTLIRLTFGSVDDVLTWSGAVDDLNVLRVCTEISLALRQAVEKYYLNAETDEEAVYTLSALKYLIKMRLIGEQCYVISKNKQSGDEIAQTLEQINSRKGTSYESLSAYLDAAQERLLTYRDSLFTSYYTNLEIPEAPVVTLNYQTNTTNETFSSAYEYSFEGSVWYDCTGGTISFTPGTVNKYLWVRVKETQDSYAGNITKIVIPAMPRITGDISMMYMEDGYQITGLSAGTYRYAFTNERTEQTLHNTITVADGEIIKILTEEKWTYLAIEKAATDTSFTSQVRYLVPEQPWVINTDTHVVTGLEEQTTALTVEVYYAVKGYSVTVVDADGNTTEMVGTGCIVTLDGESYRTVVSGDVDGDAEITMDDLYGILDYINGDGELEGVYFEAGRLCQEEDIGIFDLLAEVDNIADAEE